MERIGYDDLLAARVRQLAIIQERIDRILTLPIGGLVRLADLVDLRNEVADMIREAEREHAEF